MIRRLWSWWVIRNYVKAGLSWGDAYSYIFMGECVGYHGRLKRLIKWQDRYERLGYLPVPWDVWVRAGGYGKSFKHLLLCRKPE